MNTGYYTLLLIANSRVSISYNEIITKLFNGNSQKQSKGNLVRIPALKSNSFFYNFITIHYIQLELLILKSVKNCFVNFFYYCGWNLKKEFFCLKYV